MLEEGLAAAGVGAVEQHMSDGASGRDEVGAPQAKMWQVKGRAMEGAVKAGDHGPLGTLLSHRRGTIVPCLLPLAALSSLTMDQQHHHSAAPTFSPGITARVALQFVLCPALPFQWGCCTLGVALLPHASSEIHLSTWAGQREGCPPSITNKLVGHA